MWLASLAKMRLFKQFLEILTGFFRPFRSGRSSSFSFLLFFLSCRGYGHFYQSKGCALIMHCLLSFAKKCMKSWKIDPKNEESIEAPWMNRLFMQNTRFKSFLEFWNVCLLLPQLFRSCFIDAHTFCSFSCLRLLSSAKA